MQLEYIKLRNKKRVQDSKCQALQELCSKQRLEIDVLREEASHKGKLSATVSLLEMESGGQELQISLSALELLSSTPNALSSSNVMSTSTTVSKDIPQCWSSTAGAAVIAAAQLLATVKAYPLLEKWLAAGTDQSTMAAQESVPAKHITSAATWRDALPACDTILAATIFKNFQPVAVPVWATADSDDKESSSVIDSYTKSSLFSSPWDAAAAAAELDASAYDVVDYELLWTKGPQYWYDHDDDWGIDDE
ncbi:hypothetical protein WJX79_005821 [Trebouxia sp. C0005]